MGGFQLFEKEETFSKRLLSRSPVTEHWPTSCRMLMPNQSPARISLDSWGSPSVPEDGSHPAEAQGLGKEGVDS